MTLQGLAYGESCQQVKARCGLGSCGYRIA